MSADAANTTSTGHAMSGAEWLDVHFEACRPEYEAIIRSAGFAPGSRVLDVGCGSGAFLPLLAELVGPTGSLAAVDLAPENIAAVERRVAAADLLCPVDAQVAGIDALPYPDDTFDGLWCSNVSQYLTDEELDRAVAEFRRVVRPGGIVAIKEVDVSVMQLTPTGPDPRLFSQLMLTAYQYGPPQAQGVWRGAALPSWFRRAGLAEVRAQTTVIERFAPHSPIEKEFLVDTYRMFAGIASMNPIPEEQATEWTWLAANADEWVGRPDHHFREGNILVTGRVPA